MNDRQKAILVVDDDPDMLSGLQRLLGLDHYYVETAGSIAEMMNRSDWSNVFAILLDRKLSDDYVDDVLSQLKAVAPNAAVVMITGHSDVKSIITAFRVGVEDYLLKPINPKLLRERVRRIDVMQSMRESLQRKEDARVQAERALRGSEARLRAILEAVPNAIITIGRDGLILGFNPAAVQMFGYHEDEALGKSVRILMPSPYREDLDEYVGRYLATGDARIIGATRELTACRKDGSTFPIELSIGEVVDHGVFIGVIRDISERKALQKEVLAIADEEQRRIGQDLHDSIGQRLTGSSYVAQTLVERFSNAPRVLGDAEVTTLRDMATKLSDGIGTTIEELQTIAKGLVPVWVDARGLMDALDDLAKVTDVLDGITCAFKCDTPVDVANITTATHLYRIAQEAVANALKHGCPETILIALRADEHRLSLTIADDGCGTDLAAEPSAGMGVKIMRYRAGLIGATLDIEPAERSGTVLRCQLHALHARTGR